MIKWILNPFTKTLQAISEDKVQFRILDDELQYSYEGEDDWQTVMPMPEDGEPGKQVQLSKQLIQGEIWIAWRYEGDTEWIPLVKIDDLRGKDGSDGDEVELWTQDGWIVWKYEDEPADAWKRLIQISTLEGDPGKDGREVEFATQIISGVEWITWRYVGESTWIPLIQLSALRGEPGRTPEMRFDGVSKIQWKYTDEDDALWRDLYEFSSSVLDGVDFKCMVTPGQIMTDTEKFQLIIDRICSLQKVKRTGARNYIADTIYTTAIENISCPNGYEYNPDSGLCEHALAGAGGIPEELVFVIDDSSSINTEEKVHRNTFIRDILEELRPSIQSQNTSITFVLYGIGATTLVERSYDIEGSMTILENTATNLVGYQDYEFAAWGEIYKRKDEYVDTNAVLILVTDGRYYDLDVKLSYFQSTGYEEYVNYDFLNLYKETVGGAQGPEEKITATSLRNITNWVYTLFSNRVLIMLGDNTERLYTKKSYLNLNPSGVSGTAWSDLGSLDYFPTEGDGLEGLKAYEAEFNNVSSIVNSVVGSVYDNTASVPPTITGGTSLPVTYHLGESTYLGIEWDGLMQGNVSKYSLSNPLALESTVVSMGLEERIEKDQDYAYSQFIKVDKPLAELSVWLVGAEQHLLDSIKNPIPNKWYRFEGVRNLSEITDVEKEEARVVIKYKRNPDTSKEVVSIYRPTLVHGETIPDWLPSLKEMMGGHSGSDGYAFRDATNLTPDDIVKWRDALGIGEGVGGEHNELGGLQGGNTATDQFYHLTEEQFQQLSQLLYEEHTMNLTVTPTYGEKGVKTDVTFNFTINPKQDQIISVTDNNSNTYNTTTDSLTLQDVVNTTSRTFTVQYDKSGDILNKSYTKTYNAYIPQWRGRHANADMNSYLDLSTYLGKVVQASTTIENIVMPTNQYIWFASNKSNAKIYDQNEFQQTVGTWGDGVSEFYTKPLTITLKDGTTATTYLYRSRLTKTIPSTFKYTIR